MDVKLKQYRAQKKREELIQSSKEKLLSIFNRRGSKRNFDGTMDDKSNKEKIELEPDEGDAISISSDSIENDDACDEGTCQNIILYGSLWLILYSLAIYLEFGAVYFVISSLYIIWKNTRTGPKVRGEISAYSVFNPNCEAIDGTLDAEQFEKELRYGAL